MGSTLRRQIVPTYEYMCEKCEHEFEREQRMSDPPVKTCPECRSRKVKKLISRTSFVLKGGGWYSDLYASPQDKDKSKSADSDSSTSDSGTKSESADSEKPQKKEKSEKKETPGKKTKSSSKGKSAA
jgi:putative FmdB family regulatory protein